MLSRGQVTYLAGDEDGEFMWFARTASRWAVRRHAAADWLSSPWRISVTADQMRQATEDDCLVHGAAPQRGASCECHRVVDDPYFLACEPDHPDAIAMWRCELRRAPDWWRRFRRWQYRIGAARRRPVLWGGRVTREASWLDRVLFGGGPGGLIQGDRWFRVGESELRHCSLCQRVTPHVVGYRDRLVCQSTRHHQLAGFLWDPPVYAETTR